MAILLYMPKMREANMALILRDIRTSIPMTLDVLAAKSGVSKPFLSQIETGKRGYSYKTLAMIAGALECGIADLFDDATEKRSAIMGQIHETLEAMGDDDRHKVAEFAAFLAQQKVASQSG